MYVSCFGTLNFIRLMFRARTVGSDIEVEIDGPQSLLSLSTRYGMQLADFFPAILLQTGDWTIEASLLRGRKRKFKKVMLLDKVRWACRVTTETPALDLSCRDLVLGTIRAAGPWLGGGTG